jgi:hypothetical protein
MLARDPPGLRPIYPLYWPEAPLSDAAPIKAMALPDLQAGVPVFWRLCKEQPTWCKNEGIHPNDQ